ncbi:MAG: alanine--tRNA ligase [Candidatus Micrarchaeota archaeon]|nr:alanine--tRNA ligase [Candidatus Micrarchaeota archaeon]
MVTKAELRVQFAQDWQKHYQIAPLVQRGYQRQQCESCKTHFWSIAPRKYCADASCIGYEFIGNAPSKLKLSYIDTWKTIERYFVSNGHTSLKAYPTVARWRDDLYFTIASINDFQPYVVSGEQPPPANPLLVPQTCIRFSDLTNVGVTGRHYTNFVMVGQHAFNTPKTGVFYWKDQALEHDIRYLHALGLPPEELVFKEDVWMGGGNYGPCIEYFCRGIELGNCVFMQYENTPDGGSREMATKVVDMGAGLARLCWITHGSPTSYELVFGPVIEKMKKRTGVHVEPVLFTQYAKLSGALDAEEGRSLQSQEAAIAAKMGVDQKELFSKLNAQFHLYAVADHLSTVLHAVTDGQLPSNAGGGYNLRLILRRAFGFNDEYKWDLDWASILEGHAAHLQPLFPHLSEGVRTTADVVAEELSKYRATQEKARGKVANLVTRAAKESRPITTEELTTLYISDGIPPEMVQSVAAEQKLSLSIPDDFYARVRQSDETPKLKQTIDVLGLPKTEMLCYNDEFTFRGRILAIKDGWVVLDRTAFYAESGGQVSDEGTLAGQEVKAVKKEAGVILHQIPHPEQLKVGDAISGQVLADRRRQIMAHHSGAHVLNAAAREVLGPHIWQCGSHKDEVKAHLDLTHYKRISEDELDQIELAANRIIFANLPVHKKIYPRTEAEQKFGFRIYQGGAVPGLELRIVSIGDIDHQACGGTHVDRTGDIGYFKIVKRESVQDGVERVTFKCYASAVKHVQERERLIKQMSGELGVPENQLPASVKRFFEEWKERGKQLEKLAEQMSSVTVREEIEKAKKEGKTTVELSSLPWSQKAVDSAAGDIAKAGLIAILSNADGFIVVSVPAGRSENALELLKSKGAKGGGSAQLARGKLVLPA